MLIAAHLKRPLTSTATDLREPAGSTGEARPWTPAPRSGITAPRLALAVTTAAGGALPSQDAAPHPRRAPKCPFSDAQVGVLQKGQTEKKAIAHAEAPPPYWPNRATRVTARCWVPPISKTGRFQASATSFGDALDLWR